jgi:uncharacterized hydrophobic protein (TIGR00271 family)
MSVSIRVKIVRLLKIEAADNPKVYQQLFETAEIADLNYWLELTLSAGIATLGLVLNSPAVVIGAMVVSPLMGPILASGLALAASDVYLGFKSIVSILFSVFGAIAFSAILEWLLPFHTATTEILARTRPNLLDLGVAIFSGLVGAIVVSRSGRGAGATVLPGVAIAVALMPPLCTIGFGVGSGWDWGIISGAGLLFLTNLTAISASAFLVFYLVRMDAPEVRQAMAKTVRQLSERDLMFSVLKRLGFSGAMENLGQLRFRIAMLGVAFIILVIPLTKSLRQVRDESISQIAVRDAVKQLVPADDILSDQVEVSSDRILVRLISTSSIDAAKVEAAEKSIIRRTGKEVTLNVRKVANDEELALLRERIRSTAPPPPPPEPVEFETLGKDALARLKQPIEESWPAASAELLGYEIGFSPEETVLRIRYRADRPLDAATQEILTRIVQTRLKVEKLRVILEREPKVPARKTR